MSDEWFYAKGEARKGPVNLDNLRRLLQTGYVSPGDLVWKEGLGDWAPASSVPELAASNAYAAPASGKSKAARFAFDAADSQKVSRVSLPEPPPAFEADDRVPPAQPQVAVNPPEQVSRTRIPVGTIAAVAIILAVVALRFASNRGGGGGGAQEAIPWGQYPFLMPEQVEALPEDMFERYRSWEGLTPQQIANLPAAQQEALASEGRYVETWFQIRDGIVTPDGRPGPLYHTIRRLGPRSAERLARSHNMTVAEIQEAIDQAIARNAELEKAYLELAQKEPQPSGPKVSFGGAQAPPPLPPILPAGFTQEQWDAQQSKSDPIAEKRRELERLNQKLKAIDYAIRQEQNRLKNAQGTLSMMEKSARSGTSGYDSMIEKEQNKIQASEAKLAELELEKEEVEGAIRNLNQDLAE